MFKKLTIHTGEKVLINTDKIFLIKRNDAGNGTTILSQGGAVALVKETVEEVEALAAISEEPALAKQLIKPRAKQPSKQRRKKNDKV